MDNTKRTNQGKSLMNEPKKPTSAKKPSQISSTGVENINLPSTSETNQSKKIKSTHGELYEIVSKERSKKVMEYAFAEEDLHQARLAANKHDHYSMQKVASAERRVRIKKAEIAALTQKQQQLEPSVSPKSVSKSQGIAKLVQSKKIENTKSKSENLKYVKLQPRSYESLEDMLFDKFIDKNPEDESKKALSKPESTLEFLNATFENFNANLRIKNKEELPLTNENCKLAKTTLEVAVQKNTEDPVLNYIVSDIAAVMNEVLGEESAGIRQNEDAETQNKLESIQSTKVGNTGKKHEDSVSPKAKSDVTFNDFAKIMSTVDEGMRKVTKAEGELKNAMASLKAVAGSLGEGSADIQKNQSNEEVDFELLSTSFGDLTIVSPKINRNDEIRAKLAKYQQTKAALETIIQKYKESVDHLVDFAVLNMDGILSDELENIEKSQDNDQKVKEALLEAILDDPTLPKLDSEGQPGAIAEGSTSIESTKEEATKEKKVVITRVSKLESLFYEYGKGSEADVPKLKRLFTDLKESVLKNKLPTNAEESKDLGKSVSQSKMPKKDDNSSNKNN